MIKHKIKKISKSTKLSQDKIEQIQILARNGLSLRAISRSTGINFSTVHKYAKQFSKKQSIVDFSVYDQYELGYIIGFFVGDGSQINEPKSGHYGIKFALDSKRDSDIVSFLIDLFEKAGKRVTVYIQGSWLQMKIYSKDLLIFLREFVRYEEHIRKTIKVLVNHSFWSKEFLFGFIGGLIDSDGHILEDKRSGGHFGAVITSANPVLVQQLVSLFDRLELKVKIATASPSKTALSKNPTYYIRLGKSEFCKVCRNIICLKHERFNCATKRF